MKAAAQPWQQEKLFSIEKLCVLAEGMDEVALQEVLAKNGVVVEMDNNKEVVAEVRNEEDAIDEEMEMGPSMNLESDIEELSNAEEYESD